MSLSYLQTSLDRIDTAARDDVIEICINPDGTCWGEFQGDHFMRKLDQALTATKVDLSRFDAAPITHLSYLSFEGQGAFPAEG